MIAILSIFLPHYLVVIWTSFKVKYRMELNRKWANPNCMKGECIKIFDYEWVNIANTRYNILRVKDKQRRE